MNMPKGWAPLSTWLGRQYRMPDGTWLVIRSREDMDTLIAAYDLGSIPRDKAEPKEPEPVDPEVKRRHAEAVAYVASYTGTWGLPLDIRSDRRWGTKYLRLSDRQVDALLLGGDRDVARAIDREVDEDERAAEAYVLWTERVGETDAHQRAERAASEGWYKVGDTIYKVQRAVHGSGHLYAKRLDPESGSWVYAPGMMRVLDEGKRLTIEQAAAFGHLYGRCGVCGRTLTDEASIAAGIGPVCASRL